jgi:hypothetical protein
MHLIRIWAIGAGFEWLIALVLLSALYGIVARDSVYEVRDQGYWRPVFGIDVSW